MTTLGQNTKDEKTKKPVNKILHEKLKSENNEATTKLKLFIYVSGPSQLMRPVMLSIASTNTVIQFLRYCQN